jgi:Ca2+-binding EF-hand superfamily protein
MADDDETNLIDQLAAGQADIQDEGPSTGGEGKNADGGGEGKKTDMEEMEAAAQRRADKKKLKTDWKKASPEELFIKYDADGSGEIDFDEFKVMLPELGVTLSEAKAFKYFRQCDTDGQGGIDLAEFKVALFILDPDGGNSVGFKPNSLLGPRDAFDLFDEDRSGSLDEDEFSLALEYMKLPVSDGKLEMLFAKYDADGSGSVEYKEFRQAWLQLADPKKELSARDIEFNKYAPPFQLRKQLKEAIQDEEEEEAHAQAMAETWKQFQKDKIQKDEDANNALKRANDELCNALDAAGQVYIFGSGSHEQFVGAATPPSRIFQYFNHLTKLFRERVAPDGGGNHLKFAASVADELAGTSSKSKEEDKSDDMMVRDHTGKLVLAGSKKDHTSPFDGLVCAELGCSLWARGVTKIGIGENTAFALTKAGEVIGFGGRDHLWSDILPGSRWAREDRGVMTERSQVLLGVKGRMSWYDVESVSFAAVVVVKFCHDLYLCCCLLC